MKTYLKNIFSIKSNYNSYGKEVLFYFLNLGLLFLWGMFVFGIVHAFKLTVLIHIFAGIFTITFIAVTAFLFIKFVSITDNRKTNE